MELFFSIILSFLAVRGFRYTVTEEILSPVNTESFIWLLLLLIFIWVINRSFREKDKALILYCALFGIIIALFYILGISMEKVKRISWMWINFGYLLNALSIFFSHALLYYCFAYLTFGFLRKHGSNSTAHEFSFKRVILIWVILILLYLPWYLYCFPGNLTQDSADQLDDAITVDAIRDHHSAFLTLMMRIVIVPIRALTGSLQLGTGAVSLLQMLIVTFVFALAYEWLRQYLPGRILRGLAFLCYAAYPIHYFYAVTMWKDILFSVGFLAFLLCIDAAASDEDVFFGSRRKMILLTVLLVLLPLMRHNGISIVVITAFCLLLRFPAHRKQLLLIFGGFVLLFGFWKLIALPALFVTVLVVLWIVLLVRHIQMRKKEKSEDDL